MRLIDKNALLEKIERNAYLVRHDLGFTSIEKGMTITGIRQALDEAPIVKAVPLEVLDDIMAFINTPNRDNCSYYIVDQIENYITSKMKEMGEEILPVTCTKCRHYYEDYDHNDEWSSFCRLIAGKYDEHGVIDGFGGDERYHWCPLERRRRRNDKE